jgi:predicted lipoprotein with Yx(FWY)xxD motif
MLTTILRSALFGAALTTATAAFAADAPTKTEQTSAGSTLTNSGGMTLYVYAKDKNGKSACTGACAKNWPPFEASAGATAPANYSIIKRDDGGAQWAYKGKPLYAFSKDKKSGDTSGSGLGKGAWTVATP